MNLKPKKITWDGVTFASREMYQNSQCHRLPQMNKIYHTQVVQSNTLSEINS